MMKKMSFSTTEPRTGSILTAAVVTVSDSCARGEREDLSGPAVVRLLEKLHFQVVTQQVVPDDLIPIQNLLIRLAREVRLVATTGGTGIAPRDVTPEATMAVCDRLVDGVAERMRSEGVKKTPFAALSRGVCGVRGRTLILNLPGSPSGAVESLEAVAELIPHAIELLSGKTEHK
ncbi:MAG: MogA/MoaB family molybdenum cofactor biosynthesis protein [Candidatus Sulfotelmatobacter sp.]|jgi:molybdenum cofactor synthesis domain-containing protein